LETFCAFARTESLREMVRSVSSGNNQADVVVHTG
jgi:hypothetical protein